MNARSVLLCVFFGGMVFTPLRADNPTTDTATSSAAEATVAAETTAAQEATDTTEDSAVDAAEQARLRAEAEANRQRARVKRRYDAVLEALEADGGAYNPGLSEVLISMSDAFHAVGLEEEAVEHLQRAAHITRVNEGLYSTASIPILEKLIEMSASAGNWEDVGAGYQQMFRIQKKAFGEDEKQLLPAMQKLSSWHIKAYQEGLGENPINHLISAQSLYQSSAQIMENSDDISDRQLIETLRQQAVTNYLLAAYVPTDESAAFNWEVNSGAARQDSAMAEQSHVIANYMSGKEALSRVVDIYDTTPDASPGDRADALAQLGDWHLMFSRRSTAMQYYQEAWAMLDAARTEGLDVPDDMFKKPVALPIEPETLKVADSPYPPDTEFGYLVIRFDVSMTGRAGDIEVVEAKPEDAEDALSTLRKRLRATRFRPRLDNGQPVATEDITYKYTYPL